MVNLSDTLPQELAAAVSNLGDPSALADFIAANLHIKTEERYAILEELDVNKRLKMVSGYIEHEIEVLEVQSQIQADVRGELDKRQREFILREQMKAIQKELGEGDITPELSELKQRLSQADLPEAVQREADRELQRLTNIPSISPEYGVARTYLEWLADLPWHTSTEDLLDIIRAEAVLERGPLRARQGETADPRLPGGNQAAAGRDPRSDLVFRRSPRHGKDFAGAVHRPRARAEVHPHVARRHA